MINVEQGGEYTGETYIWCARCGGNMRPVRDGEPGTFTGNSLEELAAFIAEHTHGPLS